MFCQFKDLFGKPREGPHQYRIPIVDLAAMDVAVVALAGYFIGVQYMKYSVFSVFIFLVISTIVSHRMVCAETALDQFLFGKSKNNKLDS